MKRTRWIAALLAALMVFTSAPAMLAANVNQPATRGELCNMLLNAADAYNKDVKKSDILKGYEDGKLHEERGATRAEALVMLKRAFGTLPKPVGDNLRTAYPAAKFTDIPAWAKTELQNVFDAGIVAGTSATTFSPAAPVTEAQMELFIRRVYSLMGSNVKDDLAATVNKEYLDKSVIAPGQMMGGTIADLSQKSSDDVWKLLNDIVSAKKTYTQGSAEQKIYDLYHNIMNWDARNKTGITPIKPYLDAIQKAKSLDELMAVQKKTVDELGVPLLMGFTISSDLMDSTKIVLAFGGMQPSMNKEVYETAGAQQTIYKKYLKTLAGLGGLGEEQAEKTAQAFFSMESDLAANMLEPQDSGNLEKIYNMYTMQQLKDMFKNVDLDEVFRQSGLKSGGEIFVMDKGLLESNARFMNEKNLENLKAYATMGILGNFGGVLSRDFEDAAQNFSKEYLGISGDAGDEANAAAVVQNLMSEYLGKVYAEKNFSEKAKNDVTDMIKDFIAIYKNRIEKLDWMSDATKAKAIRKLETMKIKVGYPDNWETPMDDIDIKSVANGGSYFQNMVDILKMQKKLGVEQQSNKIDKTQWAMTAYTVNAMYNAQWNDITFPAGILQAPMYDVNAPREQNLGGIGYIIAHEITHAFDNNGAQFDENGNAANWWTEQDMAAFKKLCGQAIALYDGQEAAPGILCNGELTLSENIADLGAAACITEAALKLPNPNMKLLYESMARTWASTASRETRMYLSQVDVHSPDKLRSNRVVQTLEEFYKAFDIKPGDGMYLAPEKRVKIW